VSPRYRRADISVADDLPDWVHDDRVRALGARRAVGAVSADGSVLYRNLSEAADGRPVFRIVERAGDRLWIRREIWNGRFDLSCLRDNNRPLLQQRQQHHPHDPAPADTLRQSGPS
jgi:hypothetical protein